MNNSLTVEALCTIGEDLDRRGIRTFVIKCEPEVFIVEAGYQAPPAVTPVTIHYACKDVGQLDPSRPEGSEHLCATRSFIYLSQILSAIGIYVADKGGSLVSLSNTGSAGSRAVIDVEYEVSGSDRKSERLTDADVYALCIRGHKRREKRRSTTDLRYTRFSSLQPRV